MTSLHQVHLEGRTKQVLTCTPLQFCLMSSWDYDNFRLLMRRKCVSHSVESRYLPIKVLKNLSL